jgi:hypothetical protein
LPKLFDRTNNLHFSRRFNFWHKRPVFLQGPALRFRTLKYYTDIIHKPPFLYPLFMATMFNDITNLKEFWGSTNLDPYRLQYFLSIFIKQIPFFSAKSNSPISAFNVINRIAASMIKRLNTGGYTFVLDYFSLERKYEELFAIEKKGHTMLMYMLTNISELWRKRGKALPFSDLVLLFGRVNP